MGRRRKNDTFWSTLLLLNLFSSPSRSRRKKDDVSLGDLLIVFFGIFWLIGIGIYACYKLLEWTVKGVVYIIMGIAKIIEYFSNKSNKSNVKTYNNTNSRNNYSTGKTILPSKSTTSTLLPKPLSNNNINYREPIKYEKQKLMLPKYKVITPYDALFTDIIMARGVDYFNSKKVTNYKLEEQVCTADVIGSEDYNTKIVFYKNGKIKKAECTCPYFSKDNVYCKHIYALLLNYCDNEHIDGFVNEKFYEEKSKSVPNYKVDNAYNKMIAICDAMKEIINNAQEYYDELENTEDIEDTYTEIMEYEEKLKKYQNSKITEVNQLLINSAQNDLDDMRSLYDELEIEIDEIEDDEDSSDDYEFNEALAAGFVAHEMHKDYLKRKEQEEYENEREELKNTWGLLDHEIDEVQKGNYEPWQFEEPGSGEELEEDDYYYDDFD